MRGSELRSAKEELETRLIGSDDDRERQELRRRIEELDAELRRRAQIGRTGRNPSERDPAGGGENPSRAPSDYDDGE
jgi:hypothetical protein